MRHSSVVGLALISLAIVMGTETAFGITPGLDLTAQVRAETRLGPIDAENRIHHRGALPGGLREELSAHSEDIGGQFSNATLWGEAFLGMLRGEVHADAFIGVPPVPGATAFVALTLEWTDQILPISPVLPLGAPVDYLLTATLFSSASTNASRCPSATAIASALAIGGGASTGFIKDTDCSPPDERSRTAMIHAFIGERFFMEGGLSLSVGLGASRDHPQVFGDVDASHTATFYLDPMGPDFSYRTISGVTYFSPQQPPPPQPTTGPPALLLLGAGLAGLLARAMRRGSNTSPPR